MALFASPLRLRRIRLVLAAAGSAGVVVVALLAACIVADPPAELPPPPNLPPRIVQGSVVPPTSRVIGSDWPDEFLVPVELVDPSQTFTWEVFVDFDQFKNELPLYHGVVAPDPTALDSGVRLVPFSLQPPDPSTCHVIEFLVAVSFDPAYPHTPTDPPGGDGVSWFYNPSGDLGGCPVYDAGAAADGSFPPDAGPDVLLLPDMGGGG